MEQINDKYYLGSSKNTFILYEKKISASGKESYKNIGYISTLDLLHSTIIEKEIKGDLSIVKNIEKINEMIKELKEFTIKYVDEHNEKIG